MDFGDYNDANAGVTASDGFLTGSIGGSSGDSTGYGYNFVLPGDVNDMTQQAFVPEVAQRQGLTWWESSIAYGLTRAIDNRFGPVQTAGNTNPGSFAGQNGRTYGNAPTNSGRTTQPVAQPQGGMGVAILAGLAALAFMG